MLAAYGLAMLVWGLLRLPETLHPEYRRSLAPREILGAAVQTVREPLSRGYTLALTVTFGALIAYISSIQQIVFDVFEAPGAIGLVFGAVAAPMALASWTNARVVGRYGLRRVGHGAQCRTKDGCGRTVSYVARAAAFYTNHLGFKLEHQQLPAFASASRIFRRRSTR